MADDKPKIIVDSDWKSQAQAEKDKLAAEEAKKAAARAAAPKGPGGVPGQRAQGAGGGGGGQREMPPADFQGLMGTLVTQALLYMGGFPDPKTGRAILAPEYARFHIDLLGVLEAKTKGNLTPEESKEMSQVLHELRMRYVEVTKAIEEMAREEAMGGGAAGAIPGGVSINPGAVQQGQPMGPGSAGPGKLVY